MPKAPVKKPRRQLTDKQLRRKAARMYRALTPYFFKQRTTTTRAEAMKTGKADSKITSPKEKARMARKLMKNTSFSSESAPDSGLYDINLRRDLRGKAFYNDAAHEALHIFQNLRAMPKGDSLLKNLGEKGGLEAAQIMQERVKGKAMPKVTTLIPTAVGNYFPSIKFYRKLKKDKVPLSENLRNEKKLAECIEIFSKEVEQHGISEKVKLHTPFGKKDSYQIGDNLGRYAAGLEVRTGAKHAGLVFLGFLSEDGSFVKAKAKTIQWAMVKLKTSKKRK